MGKVINKRKEAAGVGSKVLKSLLKMTLAAGVLTAFANQALAQSMETEKKIWLANKADLADLEGETVRLIQKDPDSAYAHYLVGMLYLRQFKADPAELRYLKQASELGQQAIEMQPEQEYGYLIAAQVLDLMGYGENSMSMLDSREVKMKQSWRSDFVKGLLMMDQAANEDILKQFDVALSSKEAPRDVIIPYVNSALIAAADGEELVAELSVWNKKYPNPLFQQSLAGALTSVKRFSQAHELYKQLESSHPELVQNTISDAILMYSQLGRVKEAEKMLENILKSKDLDKTRRGIAKAHLAAISLKSGQKEKARQYFADVIAENGESSMEWISFAHKNYDWQKSLDSFVALLEDLRGRLPGSSYVYALQGEVLSEGLNQHQKAVESFADAILLDPKRSEFHNGMGLAYYRMNKNEMALTAFHRALKLDPKDATARYNEACVLSVMGRGNEAIDSLKTAINLDGRLQELAAKDKDFESLRENQAFQSLVTTIKTTKVP